MLKENEVKLTSSYIFHIGLPVEENPANFLYNQITRKSNEIKTQLYFNSSKYPSHWLTKVTLHCIKNVISAKLDRAKKIAPNCLFEVNKIKATFCATVFYAKLYKKQLRLSIKWNKHHTEAAFR